VFDRDARAATNAVKVNDKNEARSHISRRCKNYLQFRSHALWQPGRLPDCACGVSDEVSMASLIFGLLLVLAAILMLRLAKPQPDGSPVRFLAGDGLVTVYALFVTAFVSMGVVMTINGTVRLVAVASAYVD